MALANNTTTGRPRPFRNPAGRPRKRTADPDCNLSCCPDEACKAAACVIATTQTLLEKCRGTCSANQPTSTEVEDSTDPRR